jgi:type IV pilus assembly protein PilO
VKTSSLPTIDFRAVLSDFQDLNPKDLGAWPLVPRVTVLVGLCLVILAAGWWFLWAEQLESLQVKQETELKLRDEYVTKKAQALNLDLYVQRLNEIERSFGTLLKQLPNKSEVESLLVEINQAGMGRGLQFDLFKPGAEQVKDFYAELPITVRLTGTYLWFLRRGHRRVVQNCLEQYRDYHEPAEQGRHTGHARPPRPSGRSARCPELSP